MPRGPVQGGPEAGAAGVAMVVAAALALVLFVTLADGVTVVFTRQAVRAAIDEGVRVGSRSESPTAACEARARAVLEGLLGPAVRDRVVVVCAPSGSGAVHASADVRVVPWLPGVPEWELRVRSSATREAFP